MKHLKLFENEIFLVKDLEVTCKYKVFFKKSNRILCKECDLYDGKKRNQICDTLHILRYCKAGNYLKKIEEVKNEKDI